MQPKLTNLKQQNIIFLPVKGMQNMSSAFDKMVSWSEPLGLLQSSNLTTIYHDSFRDTSASDIHMSIGIITSKNLQIPDDFETRRISSGNYIMGTYEITGEEFGPKWTGLFGWMNSNGFKKRPDQDPFEVYLNNGHEHPEKKFKVEFYIPIR